MLEVYHELQPKPKTILKLKDALTHYSGSGLPCRENSIAKGVKNFRKQIDTCVPANGKYMYSEHET